MRDMFHILNAVQSIAPIVGNDDTEGTGVGVDLKGYNGALVLFNFGVSGDTLSGSVKVQAVLDESDDNSNWTAVAAADMVGEADLTLIDDAAEDPDVQRVAYVGNKRYIRGRVDFTGTHTNGMPISCTVIRGFPNYSLTS